MLQVICKGHILGRNLQIRKGNVLPSISETLVTHCSIAAAAYDFPCVCDNQTINGVIWLKHFISLLRFLARMRCCKAVSIT